MVRHFSQVVARTIGDENQQSMQTSFSQKAQRPFVSFPTLRIGVAFKDFKKSYGVVFTSTRRHVLLATNNTLRAFNDFLTTSAAQLFIGARSTGRHTTG